jgi:hypothetical protein
MKNTELSPALLDAEEETVPRWMSFVVVTIATLVIPAGLYAIYSGWNTIQAQNKMLGMLSEQEVATSVGQHGMWDCSNTTTKEPGKPEVVVATRCWSTARITLEPPNQ